METNWRARVDAVGVVVFRCEVAVRLELGGLGAEPMLQGQTAKFPESPAKRGIGRGWLLPILPLSG